MEMRRIIWAVSSDGKCESMPDAGHMLYSTILRSLVGTSGGLDSYRIVCTEFRGLQLDL